jgi:hypothetical protein
MEFSTFFYHSNQFPYCITFINNKKNLFEIIISTIDHEGYNIEDFNEDIFVLTYDELKNSKNLYKIYILSILMTENPKELIYSEKGTRISDNIWCISTIKNWKGMYFTKNYEKSYAFETYPTEIIIDDIEINNEIKEYYLQEFSRDNYLFSKCNSKIVNNFLNDNIDKYIDYNICLIEEQIKEVEKNVYSVKKYSLFVDKLTKSKNIEDTSSIILRKIFSKL